MFEACATYEAGILEPKDFPPTDDPVWILGKKYSAHYDLDELRADVRSRLWFTYRKGFVPIGGNGPTSDCGWGCMLRCGQMVLAEALLRRHLSRDWSWDAGTFDSTYMKILKLFEDKKDAIYSIHQIAQMGVCEGKTVGQWFGPNTVAQVLRKLAIYDEWSSVAVHVAMDNTVIIDEVKMECLYKELQHSELASSSVKPFKNASQFAVFRNNGLIEDSVASVKSTEHQFWRPLLLIIPLRLGLSEINPVYIQGLKKCFALKQSLGIIGGKPNHACYFIGYFGSELVYLDPHTNQQSVCLDCVDPSYRTIVDESYHCASACRMDFIQLDPSVAVCFYCKSEEEFDTLCEQLQRLIVEQEIQPLFEICKERSWLAAEGYGLKDCEYNTEYAIICQDRRFDTSDDEFEIL